MTTTTPTSRYAVCSNCGRKEQLTVIEVRDRNTGRTATISLCGECETGRHRTWKLRYER